MSNNGGYPLGWDDQSASALVERVMDYCEAKYGVSEWSVDVVVEGVLCCLATDGQLQPTT
jgi:hypothetical protein